MGGGRRDETEEVGSSGTLEQSTDRVSCEYDPMYEETQLTAILLIPHPIQSSLPLPLTELEPAKAPPLAQSLKTPSSGRTRSVAMYTCVSVSTESMYRILWSQERQMSRRPCLRSRLTHRGDVSS